MFHLQFYQSGVLQKTKTYPSHFMAWAVGEHWRSLDIRNSFLIENSPQPRPFDVVLGGNQPDINTAAVLGNVHRQNLQMPCVKSPHLPL